MFYNFSQEYFDYDISRQIELESYGYRFPKTHDIAYLIELLEKGGVEVPDNLQNAKKNRLCLFLLNICALTG